jgi:TonB-linked SusC/RagA family outer membrane protein
MFNTMKKKEQHFLLLETKRVLMICLLAVLVFANLFAQTEIVTSTVKEEAGSQFRDTLDSGKIFQLPFISVQQYLKGSTAGVYVQENNGEPGTIQSMLVRGLSSPVFSNKDVSGVQPAVYINGVPLIQENSYVYDIKQFDVNPIGAASNKLAGLDISSIASIEVIKDPLQLAKLGPLASNGAIMIRTKDGYYGGKNISIGVSAGMAFAPSSVNMTNASYEKAFRQRFYDAYPQAAVSMPEYLTDSRDARYFGEPDWADNYYQSAPLYNINASIGGGSKIANYVFSLAATKDAGVADKTSYTKYNIGFGLNMIPLDALNVSLVINASNISRKRNQNFRDRFAEMEYMVDFSTPLAPGGNSYADFLTSNDLTKDDNFNNLMNGLLSLTYTKKRFTAVVSLKFDYTTNIRRAFWPMSYLQSVNFVSNYSGYNQRAIGDGVLGYSLPLSDAHKMNIQWNGSILADLYHYSYTRAYDGDDDMKPTTSSGNFKQYRYADRLENKLVSTSLSFDYKYKNLLNLGLLARYDGNSAVQSDSRWMFTPAASAEWNLKNQFLSSNSVLSVLSLRASYARIAKSVQSDRYELGPQYLASSITWSGEPLLSSANGYATITRPYVSAWVGYDMKMPYSDKIELSLNSSFFNNRLSAGISVYKNNDKDMLTYLPVTQEMGYEYKLASGMEVSNRGVELTLSADILKNSPLTWNMSFNANYNVNRLEKLPENQTETVIGDYKLQVGQPIDAFWVYQNKGIYTSDSSVPVKDGKKLNMNGVAFQAGDPIWTDADGNNQINNDDRVLIGHAIPPYTGGLTNSFAYKRFDFSFSFFFALGHSALNLRDQQRYDFVTLDNMQSLQSIKEIFFWQNTNQRDDYPIYNPASGIHPYRAEQDLFLEKLSYLKLRNVSLGYTLPLKKKKDGNAPESLYFYLSGANLLSFSNFSAGDPELVNFDGTYDGYSLPIPRSILLGLKFNF